MNALPLTNAGYDGSYVMYEDGTVFNTNTSKKLKEDERGRVTIYKNGQPIHKSVRVLYKEVFDRYLQRPDNILNLKGEQWKEIEGSKGEYLISNKGRFKSYSKHSKARLIYPFRRHGDNKYLSINLYINGNRNTFLAHRLVAKYFLNNYSEDKVIHHIDGNPYNNSVENLKALTQEEHFNIHRKNQLEKKREGVTADDKEILHTI